MNTFCHFPNEVKLAVQLQLSRTFVWTLNHDPFGSSKYSNRLLHSCQIFLFRTPVFLLPLYIHTHSYTSIATNSYGYLFPLSPFATHGIFLDTLSLAAMFVGSLAHSRQRGQLHLFVIFYLFFFVIFLDLDVSTYLLSLSFFNYNKFNTTTGI